MHVNHSKKYTQRVCLLICAIAIVLIAVAVLRSCFNSKRTGISTDEDTMYTSTIDGRHLQRILMQSESAPAIGSMNHRRKLTNIGKEKRIVLFQDLIGVPNRKLLPRVTYKKMKYNNDDKKQRLPHVIIFGAKKSGTKTLITFLDAHSKIVTAEKEAHYFDNRFELGLDAYRRMMPFSNKDQLTIEKTPGYLMDIEVPSRIKDSLPPTVKFIVILRDPVTRAISDYTHYVAKQRSRNATVLPIESLIFKPGTRVINERAKSIKTGLYAQHLRRWLTVFDRNRLLVVDGDRFIHEPWTELKRIEEFLNIPLELTKASFKFNYKKGFYCVRRNDRRNPLQAKRAYRVECLASNKGRTHEPIDASTEKILSEFYSKSDRELQRLLGYRMSWMS